MISTRVLAGTQVFVAQAQFVDRSDGYVLAEGSPGVGMLPRPVLYRTQDGGATWRLLSTDFSSSDSTVQMRFISRRDGWIVAVNRAYEPLRVFAYHTKDGGASWTETDFSLPPYAATNGRLVALPPTFQNARDGTMQVVSQWAGLLIFTTTDGGQRWTFNPLGNG